MQKMQDEGSWSEEKEDMLRDVLVTIFVGKPMSPGLLTILFLIASLLSGGADTVSIRSARTTVGHTIVTES